MNIEENLFELVNHLWLKVRDAKNEIKDLRQHVAKKPLTIDRAEIYATQLCAANNIIAARDKAMGELKEENERVRKDLRAIDKTVIEQAAIITEGVDKRVDQQRLIVDLEGELRESKVITQGLHEQLEDREGPLEHQIRHWVNQVREAQDRVKESLEHQAKYKEQVRKLKLAASRAERFVQSAISQGMIPTTWIKKDVNILRNDLEYLT